MPTAVPSTTKNEKPHVNIINFLRLRYNNIQYIYINFKVKFNEKEN